MKQMISPNNLLRKQTQFVLLVVFLNVLLSFNSSGQMVSKSEVFPRKKFNYLLKSPTSYTCDSLGEFNIVWMFYVNKMPMSDNQKIIWSCGIGQGDGRPTPENLPDCTKLETRKIYFFFDSEVYVFSFSGSLNKEAKKIYTTPQAIVIEYFDKEKKKIGYLKSTGRFVAGEVQ